MANLPPFNLPQSVFMISLGSNALFGQMNIMPDALQTELRNFLAGTSAAAGGQGPFFQALNRPGQAWPSLAIASGQAKGDWCTVWGPVVYQGELNPGATNAMYVAYSKKLQTYVVAIAGTNPTGDYALFVEDLAVQPARMVVWPPSLSSASPPALNWASIPQAESNGSTAQLIQQMPDPSSPYIDAGTSDGLNILYTMQDTKGKWWDPLKKETSTTLAQFLDSVTQSGQTLVFTGHSLGGALAPTLAMLLYPLAAKSPGPANGSDPSLKSGWANVFVLATAGPTPGTQGFANLFFTPPAAPVIGAQEPVLTVDPPLPPPAATGPYAPIATNAPQSQATWQFTYWNVIYANCYDVVPRAWNALANLVQQPNTGSGGNYPSFFGGGLSLSPSTGPFDVMAVGPGAYDLINKMTAKSGYSGNATNYYVPCLLHVPFNGVFGDWTTSSAYPPAPWTPAAPTGPIASLGDLKSAILNAHLGQYPSAFLGYPCPTIQNVPVPPSS